MAYTPYIKTIWKDDPSEETPIEAEKLNNIEGGIEALENNSIFYEVVGEINEETGAITLYDTTTTETETAETN